MKKKFLPSFLISLFFVFLFNVNVFALTNSKVNIASAKNNTNFDQNDITKYQPKSKIRTGFFINGSAGYYVNTPSVEVSQKHFLNIGVGLGLQYYGNNNRIYAAIYTGGDLVVSNNFRLEGSARIGYKIQESSKVATAIYLTSGATFLINDLTNYSSLFAVVVAPKVGAGIIFQFNRFFGIGVEYSLDILNKRSQITPTSQELFLPMYHYIKTSIQVTF